jgi:hypothetical protein
VSTASLVPETWEVTGGYARETLLHTGRRRLLADALQRNPPVERVAPSVR